MCCAATLHHCADKQVIQIAEQRSNLPLWAKIGIALKSDNEPLLHELINSKKVHIHIALSDNSNMTKDHVLALISNTKKDRVLANIANHYIDDNEILQTIIKHCENHNLWLKSMHSLLDIKTKATPLRKILKGFQREFLFLSRLIVRHPNCPKPYFQARVYYLHDDAKQNPNYKKLLADREVVSLADDGWQIDKKLDSGLAHEYLTSWINTKPTRNLSNKRKTISCENNNPNQVRAFTIADDSYTHRRFIHRSTPEFSEYEYRILFHVAAPAVKKAIIEKHQLSKELIIELVHKKDKLISMVALTVANKRGFDVDVKIDSTSLKTLGNKAARMELANKSTDLDILKMLVFDKTCDVRAAVAEREALDLESLVSLLKDSDDNVVRSSLLTIYYDKLEKTQQHKCQNYFREIVKNNKRGDYLREWAFKYITEEEFIDSHYQQGEGLFDKIILSKTTNNEIIDQAIFGILRGDEKISSYYLSDNPNLSQQQAERLMVKSTKLFEQLLGAASTTEHLLSLYKKNGSKFHNSNLYDSHTSIYHNVDFSQSDIKLLHKSLDKSNFINITEKQLHKLDEAWFSDLLPTIYPCDDFDKVIDNNHYSNKARSILLNFIIEHKDTKCLSYYIDQHPVIESQLIDVLLSHQSEDIRLSVINYQELSKEQALLASRDSSFYVKKELFDSKKIEHQELSDDFLITLACRNDDNSSMYHAVSSFQSRAIAELKRRNFPLPDSCKPCPASTILEQFNVSLSAIQFNKIMLEKGFLQIEKRESYYESGKYNESKKLAEHALQYGYNDNYNDTVNYYPIFFNSLINELGINIEE